MRVSAKPVLLALVSTGSQRIVHRRGLFLLFFLVFPLFLRAENVMQNNLLGGARATVLWSPATDLWFRAYSFMVTCYRNMVPSTGARPCCYKFMVPGLFPPLGTLLLQIYGRGPSQGSCYRFMVMAILGHSATDLWSRAPGPDATTLIAR